MNSYGFFSSISKLVSSELLFTPILEEVDRMQGILVSTIQKLKS
ncbi:MAG: hypothetical protein WBM62_04805 [Crocosphaera sp.]